MLRRAAVVAILLVLVRSQGRTRRPRYESIDDLPAFYSMLTAHIGQMVPPEGQPYHQYYAELFKPYYPYSKAQINAALLGDLVTQASPLHYELSPPGYGWNG